MTKEEIFKCFPAIKKMADYENSDIMIYELNSKHIIDKYLNVFTSFGDNYHDELIKIVAVLKDGKMMSDILIGEYFRDEHTEIEYPGETLGIYIIRKNIINDLDYFIIQRRGHSTKLNTAWNEILIFQSNPNIVKVIKTRRLEK